jgi:DNA-binding response OmpR family regulator
MMRALVIDDDVNVGEAIQAILASQRFETVHALRASSGIHALEQQNFDVVIVDLFLPGISGLDTIYRIRQQAPDVPIIAMTGFRYRHRVSNSTTDLLDLAKRRGATLHIQKPFTPSQLVDAIGASIERCRASQPASFERELQP